MIVKSKPSSSLVQGVNEEISIGEGGRAAVSRILGARLSLPKGSLQAIEAQIG